MKDNPVTINFMVATDMHVGHRSENHIIRNDSYEGLEEVLHLSRKRNVDFLLLGGDLFDQVNPSKDCYYKTLHIMRKYVLAGSRENDLEVFYDGKPRPCNFNDHGAGVSLPIFTIHGNHDFPNTDLGRIGSCDLLEQANFVNYFGRHFESEHIVIKPLIIGKKGTKERLAIYGLGYIKDVVLRKRFYDNKVHFEQCPKDEYTYFSIFILHQNRYKKGGEVGAPLTQCIDSKHIPEWIDLTIWGHQHEAIYEIQEQASTHVLQPGSTVLTSYIQAEAKMKQCILMSLNQGLKFENIMLTNSHRPMSVQQYEAQELLSKHGQDFDLQNFLEQKIEEVIDEHEDKKPIIRIKLEVTGLKRHMEFRKAAENKYQSKVANPQKIFVMWKKKQQRADVSDQEFKNMIESNQRFTLQESNYLSKSLQNHLKTQMQRLQPGTFYDPKFLFDHSVHFATSSETTNAEFHSKLKQYSEDKLRHEVEHITTLEKKLQKETLRTSRYQSDMIKLRIGREVNFQWWGVSNADEFKRLRSKILDLDELNQLSKQIEDRCNKKPLEKSDFEYEFKAWGEIDKDEVVFISDDSFRGNPDARDEHTKEEDCCQRAARVKPNPEEMSQNFHQARSELEATSKSVSLKVPGGMRRKSEPSQVKKKVRFSDDFL